MLKVGDVIDEAGNNITIITDIDTINRVYDCITIDSVGHFGNKYGMSALDVVISDGHWDVIDNVYNNKPKFGNDIDDILETFDKMVGIKPKCICDLHTVLMRTGCTCKGI